MYQNASGSALKIRLFGRLSVYIDGVPVAGLHRREGKRLLAYLILHAGEPVKYHTLAALFWPFEAQSAHEGSSAYQSTRQAIRSLRVAMGSEAYRIATAGKGMLCLNLDGADCDIVEFDEACVSSDPIKWKHALALHSAPLLEGWTEAWAVDARKRRLRSFERLKGLLGSTGDYSVLEPTANSGAYAPATPQSAVLRQGSIGGAMLPDSPGYIEREADRIFSKAVSSGDSTILVKGAIQSGKSSLLARGLEYARELGDRVVLTDFQTLSDAQLADAPSMFKSLIIMLCMELNIDFDSDKHWNPLFGAGLNLELFLKRSVLTDEKERFIWGMDDVDRLFQMPYCNEFIGLLRSWHNRRALDPEGPWKRLTIALTYATEADGFITDINQSPFNVGTLAEIVPFNSNQAAAINALYGSPVTSASDLQILNAYLGGNPFLLRSAIEAVTAGTADFDKLLNCEYFEAGAYARHLRRIKKGVYESADLIEGVQSILRGEPVASRGVYNRLMTRGVAGGSWKEDQRFHCELYARYFASIMDAGS
jgi:AAA-like domain